MTTLRKDLEGVVEKLLAESEDRAEVTLDAIGEAIGTRLVSQDEIDTIMKTLEARGRRIVGPEGGGNERRLGQVIATARVLSGELGRKPNMTEIAERSGLSVEDVRHALALARIMQR